MTSNKRLILALLAVLITVGTLWWTNRAVTPQKSTMADVRAEATASGYRLINTDQLAEKYRNPPLGMLLVDTRQDWEYRAGHIKGAINFAMEPTWWSRWHKKNDMALVLGPDKDRLLIFY